MSARQKLFLKFTAWIAFLKTLGGWGVLVLAAVDSIAIPIPLDALVASYVYATPRHAWIFCIAGAAGSALGSLVPYALGRAGGELFLLKRISEDRLQRIRDRFEKQEFLALAIPAMMPPPTPFKLLVFSAGVFEMRVINFLLAIFVGRVARFAILSILTMKFGPQVVSQVRGVFTHHPVIGILGLIVLAALVYVVVRAIKAPAKEIAEALEEGEQQKSSRKQN
ncbi:MAG TPA: VTT domain-containing protein [Candidatus Limnocylindrales bacterium]|nr:VTT domain-containing protein [Candidatus Limnocylindrales bacterium]